MEELWTIATTNTWAVVVTGLLVVFVALVALVIFVWIIGKIFESIGNSKNPKQKEDTIAVIPAAETELVMEEAEEAEEQDDSVIAAITAAITSFFAINGENKPFVIKSIKRAGNTKANRSAWNAASISDNTRPF